MTRTLTMLVIGAGLFAGIAAPAPAAELSLARIAMWLLSLGLGAVDPAAPSDVGEPRMQSWATPPGQVEQS